MRRLRDTSWTPTVPALIQMLAASAGPRVSAAFAEAGLDGIRPGQALALVPLVGGGRHASDIAEQLGVSRQAVAQAVSALERHDYVARIVDPDDARAKVIELRPRGVQALRVMRSSALELEQRWTDRLGAERLELLREALTLLLDD